jgi:subtilisin family serine protease
MTAFVLACLVLSPLTATGAVRASNEGGVVVTEPYRGGPRTKDALERLRRGEPVEWDMPNFVPGQVLVSFQRGVSAREKTEIEAEAGAVSSQLVTRYESGEDVQLLYLKPGVSEAETIKELMMTPGVKSADLNYYARIAYEPPSADFEKQWGLENTGQVIEGQAGVPCSDIDATEAWDIERGNGAPVTVAVIDSGIDMNHPLLQDKLWTNVDELPNNDVDDDGNGVVDDCHGANPTGIGNFWTTTAHSFGTSYDSMVWAQSFTAQADPGDTFDLYQLETIHTKIANEAGDYPDYDIMVSVRESLDGDDLAYFVIEPDDIDEFPNITIKVGDLSQPVRCEAGRTYYIVYTAVTDHPHEECYTIHSTFLREEGQPLTDVYREGCAWQYKLHEGWVSLGHADLHFDTNGNYYPHDLHGHGTHCAGIICAGGGSSGPVGVAHGGNVKVMPIKTTDCNGLMNDMQILWAINYARSNGADIISMSLAGSSPNDAIAEAIENAWRAGSAVFAAVGNDSGTLVRYPAGYNHVIGVGATDNRDEHAAFSNWNWTVDVSAPGVDYYSTMPSYPVCLNSEGLPMNAAFMSGTSMATPCAAGVAALMLSKEPSLLPDQLESRLEQSSEDLGVTGRDDYYGHGRVNACEALGGTPTPVILEVEPTCGGTGDTVSIVTKHVNTQRSDIKVYIGDKRATISALLPGKVLIKVPGGLEEGDHPLVVKVGDRESEKKVFRVVNCGTAAVAPAFGCRGETLDISIAGVGTNFGEGSQVVFAPPDGITVNSVRVTDRTHVVANITISRDAESGWRSVNVITGDEEPSPLVDAFEVRAGRIHSVLPRGGYRGETFNVFIAGTDTHFENGVSEVTFDPQDGITVNSTTVTDATHAVANITVAADAPLGPRKVNVLTDSEEPSPRERGFTVYSPRIISSSPRQAYNGDTLDVAITGRGTAFENGTSVAVFGSDVTVNSTTVADRTHAVANITVSASASTGYRDVNVITGPETPNYLQDGFLVKHPRIETLQPNIVYQGQTTDVRLVGEGTHFRAGSSELVIEPPDGIIVNSVNVIDASNVVVNLTVSGSAPETSRSINVLTGEEEPVSQEGLIVQRPWISKASPDHACRGQTVDIQVEGGHTSFVQGQSTAVFDPPEGIIVNSTTVTDSTHAVVNITVAESASPGTRSLNIVTGEQVPYSHSFQVYAGYIKAVSPDSAYAGNTLDVSIEGGYAHFAAGVSRATFSGSGITVNSTTVIDETHAVASITISPAAQGGVRSVTVVTGDETPQAGSFTVMRPFIRSVTPESGARGQNMDVWITGAGTHFVNGTTWAIFAGEDICVNCVSVTDATHAIVSISIDAGASEGWREAHMITGSEEARNAYLLVTAEPSPNTPTVTSITPDSGIQGQVINITDLAGTNFDKGGGVCDVRLRRMGFTDVIATDVNVVSPTRITCTVDLSLAWQGVWDVYVRNGENENFTLPACFTVIPRSGFQPEGGINANVPEHGVATVSPESESLAAVVAIRESIFGSGPGGADMGAASSSNQSAYEDLALSSEETDNVPEKETNEENNYSKALSLVNICLLFFLILFFSYCCRGELTI